MDELRRSGRVALSSLGPAYGFTVVVWSTGAILLHYQGTPAPWEVVIFSAGILLAMAVAAMAAFGGPRVRWRHEAPERFAAGVIHVLSVFAGVGVAWALAAAIDAAEAWAIAPFGAVLALEALVAVEIHLATPGRQPEADPRQD